MAGHCLSFRSFEILCWEAALLGNGSVGSVIEIGVCIFLHDNPLGLLHPRNKREDNICAGIAAGREVAADDGW